MILDGAVNVSKNGALPGETIFLATLETGSVLGETSVITNNHRSATVTAIQKTIALIINMSHLESDPRAEVTRNKLLHNLTIELSKKLIYFEDKLVKYTAEDQQQLELAEDKLISIPNSILVLFGWKWSDIMHEAPFLAEHGYDAILNSTHKCNSVNMISS